MDIDEPQFRTIVTAVFGAAEPGNRDSATPLTPDEGRAIIGIARLAVDSDDREDDDEIALLDQLVGHICALAGITAPPLTALPRDASERSAALSAAAAPLLGKPSAMLAYAVAYLMTISDMDIAPVEASFVDELGELIGLDPDRAEELQAKVTGILTPGE